ncbi:hypothetical protein [Edwardsiella ictaluri]|uniref:hypothetical protein n=2 Tax=Edwardsiella ictaluri TaxID=67780 RepID=UPI0008FFA63F|nr:hypothetical protein [Edwardsiella ictaluri]BEH98117.1 hypothetical protein KH20906_08450 [Edwardsiella ictaluri]BEI01586.1 hypothetical protein KB20921_08470 [Edwardsiella ictaluri]BEI05057.1 hypothetical protein KH201010_08430 [Edwardsiella ictaluri]BEI08511.1 hypothetical protein STU22726_08420 [Edwardsiella ictaluri]BEI11994.1 hypothetical protein STU22816_08470 [Edwardsiella ictaluri]
MNISKSGNYTNLCTGSWHEINRFPAANSNFRDLQDRIYELERTNEDLAERVDALDSELLSTVNELDRLKNPSYWQALDDGDGHALMALDKLERASKDQ